MQNYKALWITVLGFCLLLLTSLFDFTFAEELTLTTYYPAPYGVYKEFTTTDNTYLATTSGNVGIGTTNPQADLDVRNVARVGESTSTTYDAEHLPSHGGIILKSSGTQTRTSSMYQDDGSGNGAGGLMIKSTHYDTVIEAGTVSSADILLNPTTGGNVGIGTTSPNGVLGVNGEINFVPLAADPTTANEGDLYYNSTDQEFKYYDGDAWQSVGGGGPADWECTIRKYSLGNLTSYNWVSVTCAEGEKAISGGCHYSGSVAPTLFYNYPYHPTHPGESAITTQGWTCFAQAGGTYELTPIVNCCK